MRQLTLLLLTLLAAAVSAAAPCRSPCHPWNPDDKCSRKTGSIDMRWAVTLPTRVAKDGMNVSYLTYGFCAIVDELQSFQLNYSAASIALNKSINSTGDALYEYAPTESFAWLWGSGDSPSLQYPDLRNSSGAALVYDGQSPQCNDGPAIVTMLVFNVTLNGGKYTYENGNVVGTGFSASCDENNFCRMDPKLKCIGVDGRMNCATCLNPKNPYDVMGKDVVIFTTYYGTDSRGKTLLSGSSNPLNFRAFSGGGVYSDMARNMENLDEAGDRANPFKDVDSYDWEGISKTSLSTGVPNANMDGK